jgi:hypothetical protein
MGKAKPAPAPKDTNVTQTSIPEYARPYVEKMLGKSEALTEQPYQAYGGQRLAGFTPMQQQAFNTVGQLGPTLQGEVGSQMAGAAGLGSLYAGNQYANQATNPYAMQSYMNPYVQNALNPAMQDARRQSEITGVQNAAQAVGAGAFGGSRFGLQEAERQRNLGQNLASIYGTGMSDAYKNAQQSMQFGSTLGLQGLGQAGQIASTLGNLGQQQFSQAKDAAAAQQAVGTAQQQLEQQQLEQQYADFQNQRQYPYQQLAYMSDMLRGLPLSQYTQTMYQAPPSFLTQAAGIGAVGKGFGMFGTPSGSPSGATGGKVYEDDDGSAGINNLLANKIGRG